MHMVLISQPGQGVQPEYHVPHCPQVEARAPKPCTTLSLAQACMSLGSAAQVVAGRREQIAALCRITHGRTSCLARIARLKQAVQHCLSSGTQEQPGEQSCTGAAGGGALPVGTARKVAMKRVRPVASWRDQRTAHGASKAIRASICSPLPLSVGYTLRLACT